MKNFLILLWIIVLASIIHAEEPSVLLAQKLLAKSGLTHGIASLPRCDDGRLALAVVQNSKMLVHAMSLNRKVLDDTVQLADAEGMLSRSLYVESGSPSAMPYADNLVDLVLITDLSDADLVNVPIKEIVRVLAPARGKAIVGHAKNGAKGGTLTKSALAQWANAGEGTSVESWEDSTGTWVSISKLPLAGEQGWTHKYHGPNNDAISQDTTLKPPLMTQWLGLPLRDGWWGTTVVGDGGRLFTIWFARAKEDRDKQTLTARSVSNGTILWERILKRETDQTPYNPAHCCMVATPDRLYLIDGDGVLLLNPETGGECGRLAGPLPRGQVKWIALDAGILTMLAGDPDVMQSNSDQTYATNSCGTHLMAYEVASGKPLWQQDEAKPIDERYVAAYHGCLYAYAPGSRVSCRNLATGKLLWENTDAALLASLDKWNDKYEFSIKAQKGLTVVKEGVILGVRWNNESVVLSPDTGSILCRLKNNGNRTVLGLYLDGKWFNGDNQHAQLIDLATGIPDKNVNLALQSFPLAWCGSSTYAPGVMISMNGACVNSSNGASMAIAEGKAPCSVGTVVSDGMIITPSAQCQCSVRIFGYRALTSVATREPAGTLKPDEPLVSLSQEPPSALPVTAADWPVYRANTAHIGSTPAAMPTVLNQQWRWQPAKPVLFAPTPAKGVTRTTADAEYSATPPICVANKVWFGDAGGVIRCVDAVHGKLLWSFPTGTKMFASPSFAEGRLYAGSGNGWIYCLDATTGRELWKFRAAPSIREIMWYGHLISTWPVVTGVLLQHGVAYAAAGYQGLNDVIVYALDAVTGQPRWKTHSGNCSVFGNLTIAGDRLWMPSDDPWPLAFDLKTGAIKPFWDYWSPRTGYEMAVFSDRYIIHGGRRLDYTYDESRSGPQQSNFVAFGLKTNGAIQLPVISIMPATSELASWDTERMVVPNVTRCTKNYMECWDVPKLVNLLDETVATGRKDPILPEECCAPDPWSTRQPKSPPRMLVWSKPGCNVAAMVLASNAVAVVREVAGHKWGISALDRANGNELSAQELPAEPILSGMCINRDGQVLIVLRDGSLVCYGAK